MPALVRPAGLTPCSKSVQTRSQIPEAVVMRYPCAIASLTLALAACGQKQPAPPDPVRPAADLPSEVVVDGESLAASMAFRCGDLEVVLIEAGAASTLRIADRKISLTPQVAASGARYAGNDAGQPLEFWSKGEEASLRIGEQEFPTCRPPGSAEPDAGIVYRASGNEPAWLLEMGKDSLELILDMGSRRLVGSDLRPEDGEAGPQFYARTEAGDLRVQIVESICRDSMSGMPRPDFVGISVGDESWEGCGGDPGSLLQGVVWQIDSVNGRERVPDSQPSLEFLAEGRLVGNASCNRLTAAWTLGGESLRIPMPVTTRMACASAVMEQEDAVLAILQGHPRFDFDDAFRLVITGESGGSLSATRQFDDPSM